MSLEARKLANQISSVPRLFAECSLCRSMGSRSFFYSCCLTSALPLALSGGLWVYGDSQPWLGIVWRTARLPGCCMSWIRGAALADRFCWGRTAEVLGFITLVRFMSPVLLRYRATQEEKLVKFTALLFRSICFMSARGGKFSPIPFLLLFPSCPKDLWELIIF